MNLTIHTNNVIHNWKTGDDLADLQHAVTVLQRYIDEMKTSPLGTALDHQPPLPEPLGNQPTTAT